MKSYGTPLLQSIKTFEEFRGSATAVMTNHEKILGGNITFTDNIRAAVFPDLQFVSGVTLTISHNLGFIPLGFILVKSNVAVSLFNNDGEWNTQAIYLTSDANAICTIIIVGG